MKHTTELPINPVSKPRMTQRDKWKQRPSVMRYYAFKDEINLQVTGSLDAQFSVVFKVEMPASWSEGKKAEFDGKPHQNKPDIDNFLKALLDAMCADDSYVYDVRASKYWARKGSITIIEGE